MLIARAFKYELDPNNQQRTRLFQHAGCARFAYNWGLQQRIALYRQNQDKKRFTSAIAQHRELNRLKRTVFPWMQEFLSGIEIQEASGISQVQEAGCA
jgi:putative transposase